VAIPLFVDLFEHAGQRLCVLLDRLAKHFRVRLPPAWRLGLRRRGAGRWTRRRTRTSRAAQAAGLFGDALGLFGDALVLGGGAGDLARGRFLRVLDGPDLRDEEDGVGAHTVEEVGPRIDEVRLEEDEVADAAHREAKEHAHQRKPGAPGVAIPLRLIASLAGVAELVVVLIEPVDAVVAQRPLVALAALRAGPAQAGSFRLALPDARPVPRLVIQLLRSPEARLRAVHHAQVAAGDANPRRDSGLVLVEHPAGATPREAFAGVEVDSTPSAAHSSLLVAVGPGAAQWAVWLAPERKRAWRAGVADSRARL